MACLEMYNQNSDHHKTPISPRISFSNDFVDSGGGHSHPQLMKHERNNPRETPASSDFEFSVTNYSMMSADELFFKGRLLPFKQTLATSNNNNNNRPTTLRDELLAGDDEDDDVFSTRPPKGPTRWKGLLGLRKSHIGSKKSDRSEGSSAAERGRSSFLHDQGHLTKSSQEMVNEGASSGCEDVEFRGV